VQPSKEISALSTYEKNVLFYLIGTPFDPTLDKNYTDIPSVLKVPSKQKKMMVVKCSDFNEVKFVNQVMLFLIHSLSSAGLLEGGLRQKVLFDLSSVKYSNEHNPFVHFEINYPDFVNSLKAKFRLVASKSPQAKSRLLNNYNAIYRSSLHAFFQSKANVNFNFNWKVDYSQLSSEMDASQLQQVQKDEFNQSDHTTYNSLQSSIQGLTSSLKHQCNVVLTHAIINIKTPAKITASIRLLWQICYDYNIAEFFLRFYLNAKSVFTPERFPFLHIETLASASKSLNDDDQLKTLSIRLKLKMFAGNLSTLMAKDMHPMFLSLKLKELVQEGNLPSIHEITFFINNYYDDFKKYAVSDNVISKLNSITSLDNTAIISLSQAMPEIVAINSSLHAVHDDLNILQDSYSEENKHKTQLEIINKEAAKLALNALDNLEALNALKLKQTVLKNSHPNLSISLEKKALKTIDILEQNIRSFNKLDAELDLENVQMQNLITEMDRLEAENRSQKEMIHQLKSQNEIVSSNENKVSTLPAFEIASLIKKPSIISVIDTINAVYNTIELSPKAKSEIAKITEFHRFDMLLSKMNILASKEFIDLYERSGSQACFSLLTRKELAFQESKTTKNKKLRDFTFNDGKSRECKAHLRICSGFQEQNVLRVYFSIENGKLYIGMIAKHLEVATT
tara:strand:- start:4084 stop:6120 length:2037 start_codon:yes stop_codon:yes gene_type:complete